MKYWKKYQQDLKDNISLLSNLNKMNFAIEICHRLLPEYKKFQIKHEWGNYDLVSRCLNYCQENSNLLETNLLEVENLIDALDLVIPDTEDYGDLEGSLALDVGLAIYYCLLFLKDRKEKYIFNIANCMYNTIDFKVQEENEKLSSEALDNHPRIIKERKWQLERLKMLANNIENL